MSLWDWAGQVWAKPGVSAACLTLQDEHGQCVPLLIWALWWLEAGTVLNDAMIQDANALCRAANSSVIEPLRLARRRAAPVDRDRALARELEAERDLLAQLETLFAPACGGNKAAKPTQRGPVSGCSPAGKQPPTLADASRFPREERGQRNAGLALSRVSELWGRPLRPVDFAPLTEAVRAREPADVG